MSMGLLLWRIRVRDQRRDSRLSEVKSVESWRGGIVAGLGEGDCLAGYWADMVSFVEIAVFGERAVSVEVGSVRSAWGDLVVGPI